jgi:hypothetical protein
MHKLIIRTVLIAVLSSVAISAAVVPAEAGPRTGTSGIRPT